MKPRKVYDMYDPDLWDLIRRRPRYVNVQTAQGWCRIYRPRIVWDGPLPTIAGRVMVNPRYHCVLSAP